MKQVERSETRNAVTETGKLMSSGRKYNDWTEEVQTNGELQSRLDDLQDKILLLQGDLGNLARQYAQLLSIWIALHPSEASQALRAHPDNLANHLVQGREGSGC